MLNFGCTPTLPVDIILGTPLLLPNSHSLPEFVATMRQRMSTVFSSVRENVKSAQGRQKQVYNRASTYDIGDRVWLYVPAVRVGSTKKFASLWRGSYTVIDKISPVNYKIQLIGGYQQKIVHYGEPNLSQQSTDTPIDLPRYNADSSMDAHNGGYTTIITESESRDTRTTRPQQSRRLPQ